MIDGARERYMRLPEGFRFFVALFAVLAVIAGVAVSL